LEIGTTGIVKN